MEGKRTCWLDTGETGALTLASPRRAAAAADCQRSRAGLGRCWATALASADAASSVASACAAVASAAASAAATCWSLCRVAASSDSACAANHAKSRHRHHRDTALV